MTVKKRRNKPYDPNKISKLIGQKALQKYDLWMRYDNDVVDKITEQWIQKKGNAEDVPTKLLYPHIEGDLIIAIKHRLIDFVQEWTIKMTLHLRNVITQETEEIEIAFDLPECHYAEFRSEESKIKINRGNGIKTRWLGLDKELANFLKQFDDQNYTCDAHYAFIAVNTAFKSKQAYSHFIQEKTLRLTNGEMVA